MCFLKEESQLNFLACFDPLEISDMAESIRKVCEDSKYRQKLVQCGPKHAKKFNWDSSFKKHMDLFVTVLN